MDTNWSIEDIQQKASKNWSLEGDNQLLNLMKSISKNVEQRCMTSNNNLNRLMLDVDKTKIKLGNATTKLLDLNNSKFVEHTVADIETHPSNTEKSSTAENDKAFIPLPKAVQEAVTNGLNMMDRCYEKVFLNLEDSDEDENEKEEKHVVCHPKNPYLDRPLPHLIGSKQWNDKWHIGLIESDEEVMSDEEPEEFSQSSSEDGDSISISPQTSNPPTTSESDLVAPKATADPREDLFHRLSDEVKEKSPLFASENTQQQERIKVLPTIIPSTQPTIESINKSQQLTEPSVPFTEQPKQTIFAQQKPEQKFLNLFDDEPPLLDVPIRNERKAPNLFLDSDDDEPVPQIKKSTSIFNNNVTKGQSTPFFIPPMDNVVIDSEPRNTFKGDMDNNNIPVVGKSETKQTFKSDDFGGLFDDEPPDDFFDIIIGENNGKIDNKKAEKPNQTKTPNLFGSDDDDEDDFSKIIGTTKKLEAKRTVIERERSDKIIPERSGVSYSPFNSPFKSAQNTGPPKSYVSFLDDESPSLDDAKEETKSPPTADSDKSSSNPSNGSVVTSTRKSRSKIIYDDFAETIPKNPSPPPPLAYSKSLFNETITPPVALPENPPPKEVHDSKAVSTETKDSSRETVSDNVHTRDETDQSLSFKKNLSLFSNPEVPTVEKESKPKPNKLKTNFNINVEALLPGAKLPSQKHLATVNSEPEPDRMDEFVPVKVEDVATQSSNASQNNSNSLEDASGRLACLGRNRPKIPVRRKPSTRTGRQNLYTKSLIPENEDVISSTEATDSGSSNADKSDQVIDANPKETILKTDVADIDWLNGSATHNDSPPMESINSLVDDDEEDWLKNIEEKPPSPTKANSYEDEDWLSTNLVSTEQKPQTQNVSHVVNYDWLTTSNLPPDDINPPSNSIDDDQEQDDWLTSYLTKEKTSIVADLPNDEYDWLLSVETQQSRDVFANSKEKEIGNEIEKEKEIGNEIEKEKEIVKDKEEGEGKQREREGEKDEEDWHIKSTLQSETNVEVGEENDDWLGLPKTSISRAVEVVDKRLVRESSDIFKSNTGTRTKLFDEDGNGADSQNQSKLNLVGESSGIFESKTETKNIVHSKLFDDEDDVAQPPPIDFGKTSKQEAMKQSQPKLDVRENFTNFESKPDTKKPLQTKLFDDDDEDDDFLSSISKPKSVVKQTKPTKIDAVKTTKNVSIKATEKSLFSDDDNSDSDDLFGTSKSKKVQKKKIESSSKVKVDKPVKKGLFDDEDDDDDDIFSTKTQKQRVVQADPRKKASVAKPVASIPASNDPLADLLK